MLHDLGYECAGRNGVFSQFPAVFRPRMDVFVVFEGFSLRRAGCMMWAGRRTFQDWKKVLLVQHIRSADSGAL